MTKPSVVLGSESWLDDSISDSQVFPAEYVCYRKDRDRHGGGVFMLVHHKVSSRLFDIQTGTCEAIWAQLRLENGKVLAVCSFYRPPGSHVKVLSELGEQIIAINADYLVMGGDFNLPNIIWEQPEPTQTGYCASSKEMINISGMFTLSQLVRQSTRGHNVLDLFFTNMPEATGTPVVLPGISDHDAVLCTMRLDYASIAVTPPRRIYSYKKARVQAISESLEAYYDVFETLSESLSLQELWDVFKDKLFCLRDLHVPSWVMTARKSKSKPWASKAVRIAADKRRRAYAVFKKKPSPAASERLRRTTNAMKAVVKQAKTSFFASFHSRFKDRPKELWKFIKQSRNDQVSIPPLEVDGNIVEDPVSKAQHFNFYFSSVFSNCDYCNHAVCPVPYAAGLMNDVVFDQRGIQLLLEGLNVNSAPGPDNLPTALLSMCAPSVSKYLRIIFTKSLEEGALPWDWKMANVAPIHKTGPRSLPSNYRPVSLTSVVCKIFEHVLFSAIINHLNTFSLLTPVQHGFRRGFSCITQLTELVHDFAYALDKGFSIDCVFLDLKKAFDVVPHSLLIEKLSWYNINCTVIQWIKEYLSNRKQRVVLDGEKSQDMNVTSGVPQGSVLGPLLFFIYMNDVTAGITSSMRLFADDCVLYRIVKNQDDCELLQHDLNRFSEWCMKWGMSINSDKTVCMRFTKKKNAHSYTYVLKGKDITFVNEHKYLGIFFTSNLSWSRQIRYVCSRASRGLGFLRRNTKQFPLDTKALLYKTYIRPILEYACTVWDPWTAIDTERLERIQNLSVRFVCNDYSRNFSVSQAKSSLGWQSLHGRRKMLRLKLFHSIYHSKTGINRDNYLQNPDYISSRRDHSFKVKEFSCKTNLFKMSFFPRSISEWNSLTQQEVSSTSSETFAACLQMR